MHVRAHNTCGFCSCHGYVRTEKYELRFFCSRKIPNNTQPVKNLHCQTTKKARKMLLFTSFCPTLACTIPGLADNVVPLDDLLVILLADVGVVPDAAPADEGQKYPTQACRSIVGALPYDNLAPSMTFLQLGETRAHRSVLEAIKYAGMLWQEQMHLLVASAVKELSVDNAEQEWDPHLTTDLESEMQVWAYLMTQYNLKVGLQKFGTRGATTAMKELIQLHVMDMWRPMDTSKLGWE
jgi:hypothetical protein